MFSFKGKNTKMLMCFLAFLFFGFILVNLLGKNMEGLEPTTPGFTTPGFTTPGSTSCYDNGVVRDRNKNVIACNDWYRKPNLGIISSCNPSIRDKYVCKDTGKVNFQKNMPPSRIQWTKI
jgi:hypothetical protein